ncbi:MAG: cytochrome-c oxidase, cbb3-type subunit III [Pseudomonadota bacterium]
MAAGEKQEKEIDRPTGIETTGHEWDGIKELNNPLPRWWLTILWITVAWAVGYWVLMPSWPGITGHFAGVRNHSERANVAAALDRADAARAEQMQNLLNVSTIDDVQSDPQLLQYSMNAGESLFGDNCATCHGAGGQGVKGYPSLVDDAWIWGGSLEAIETTVHYGIRATHPESRINVMQAYGRDGLLSSEQVSDLVEYVTHISGRDAKPEAVTRGAAIFSEQCVSCHGVDGEGDQSLGAPNLTDAIWLYGGDRDDIRNTIHYGRAGVMPYWTDRLSDEQITALAVYVHSLGGGE